MEIYILSKRSARESSRASFARETAAAISVTISFFITHSRHLLPESCEIQLPGKVFHECIESMKTEFLRLCRRISSRNRTEDFWDTNLASRNSGSVPF